MQRTFPSARATDLLPTAFSFSQIPPSASHISHRLIEARLTQLTPPINPVRDLQKDRPRFICPKQEDNRKRIRKPKQGEGPARCQRAAPGCHPRAARSPEHRSEGSEGQLRISSVSSQFKYRSPSSNQPESHGRRLIKPEIASLVSAQMEKRNCVSSPQIASWSYISARWQLSSNTQTEQHGSKNFALQDFSEDFDQTRRKSHP